MSKISIFTGVRILNGGQHMKPYCIDYLNRKRFNTRVVHVGKVPVGGNNPVRVQSMTTTDTMDTEGSVEQSIRMITAGCEIVRLTAPSKRDAENLAVIKSTLLERGYSAPLVADIHFTPNAAELAADYVEKVRINPGNYADKKRFEEHNYSAESYQAELDRIESKFVPLLLKCKENGIAMRIGTNHGSLSDRIMSRYGDTPLGMVESAMEFIRICVKHDYHNLILSMKASNTLVMVQAYRLLLATMRENGMNYPLHLGVTEAGDGEDGRIKSAVGIGSLLEDGIGDTIRVSLTEAPENEIPVANKLLHKFRGNDENIYPIPNGDSINLSYDPFSYVRRETLIVNDVIGGKQPPVVVGELTNVDHIKPSHFFGFGYSYSVPLDKWNISDAAADFIYVGKNTVDFPLPGTLSILCDFALWKSRYQNNSSYYPVLRKNELSEIDSQQVAFIFHQAEDLSVEYLLNYPNCIVVLETKYANRTQLFRRFFLKLAENNIKSPVILSPSFATDDHESYQLWASSELGSILIDGFGDGIFLRGQLPSQQSNSLAFGILQATRTRISRTEYISCPSCGRTLFDLQETTAKIRKRTSHLKGLKIGIMGCIVNGPGEMADADYGYVGTGPGKIHLYKEKEIIQKNVPEENAVEALVELIKKYGDWSEPKTTK